MLPISTIKLTDDELKRIALSSAIEVKNNQKVWIENLRKQIEKYSSRKLDLTDIKNLSDLFNSDAVCATGQANSFSIENALNNEEFRNLFSEKVNEIIVKEVKSLDDYKNLYDELIQELKQRCGSRPLLKLSRALCALFPEHFSVIGSSKTLKALHDKLFDDKKCDHPAEMHSKIFNKLNKLLGPINGTDNQEFIVRMMLPWQIYSDIKETTNNMKNASSIETNEIECFNLPLNQILYGPPGTGKTYNTVSEALKIFQGSELLEENNEEGYSGDKIQFDALKLKGHIEFITFHQSFSYEDFVEGIRAETNNGELSYSIKDGVFKRISIEALYSKFEELFNDQLPEKWQVAKDKALLRKQKTTDINAETVFDPTNYSHKKLILSTCTLVDFKNAKGKGKPYVLIIDEINRGNTSRVFGELITLIETTKRTGSDEAMEAILPYSQETLTVPDNLYIIGTMNTADRSLALMDTALRRRFDFIEMMPDPSLIKGVDEKPLDIDGIKIQEMLRAINDRIEALYDREHTIGHAFFMKLKDEPTVEKLAYIFRNNILPLLEEYFFEDWDKIIKVLGKSEIYQENPNLTDTKLGFKSSTKSYLRNCDALSKPETYISIYDSVSNNNAAQAE